MAQAASSATGHAALMDSVYKGQRHIYDLTRKYYLFGRDTLIEGLDAQSGMKVLEIACGTGRNLTKIGKRWPDVELFGLDISAEMLKNARKAVGENARLGLGDACAFDPANVFETGKDKGHGFDRIVLSYALSMIPDWEKALAHGVTQLARGGELHVVDFGDLNGLPTPFKKMLHSWLAKFHVEARSNLAEAAIEIAQRHGATLHSQSGRFGYFQLYVIKAPE